MRKLGFAYKFAGSPTGTKFMHPTGAQEERASTARTVARRAARPSRAHGNMVCGQTLGVGRELRPRLRARASSGGAATISWGEGCSR